MEGIVFVRDFVFLFQQSSRDDGGQRFRLVQEPCEMEAVRRGVVDGYG